MNHSSARRARGLFLAAGALCAADSAHAAPTGYTFASHGIAVTLNNPVDLAVADLNGDTRQDVVIPYGAPGQVLWYENVPGSPPTFTQRAVDQGIPGASFLVAGPINDDSRTDLAGVYNHPTAGSNVRWTRNNGFTPPTFSPIDVSPVGGPGAVAIADLDGFNGNDIVFAGNVPSGPSVIWFQNTNAANPAWLPFNIASNTNSPAVQVADLNNDLRPDVATVDVNTNAILWFSNATVDGEPSLVFTQHTVGAAPLSASVRLAVDNLDTNGFRDVVVATETGLRWFESQGGTIPTFVPHLITFEQSQPKAVAIADINGDGRNDIVVAFGTGRSVAWYENDGHTPPEFLEHAIFSGVAAGALDSLAIGDINGDGGPDIVVSSSVSSQVYWLERETIEVSGSVIAGGGGTSDNSTLDTDVGSFVVTGTIGQHDAQASVGGGFELRGGFWQTPEGSGTCAGDANGDRVVDFFDLNIVLSDFGTTGPALAGDLNHDGTVDFIDLNLVLSFFGTAC